MFATTWSSFQKALLTPMLGHQMRLLAVVMFAAMTLFGATALDSAAQASGQPIDLADWCQKQQKEAVLYVNGTDTPDAKSWRCATVSYDSTTGSQNTIGASGVITVSKKGPEVSITIGGEHSASSEVTIHVTNITPIRNMDEVCVDQYGADWHADISDWSDPFGWSCRLNVVS